ncbi:MAG: dephospho-CoA kinase [Bacteroidota bacterium]
MKVLGIGITGGIGSGKSYVCRLFEERGYRVYYADQRAKLLMTEDEVLVSGVKSLFGPESYHEDGSLNRAHVGKIAFGDPEKLQQLNALVHPATGRDYLRWIGEIPADYPHDFVLKEAAILYESGAYKASDAVITVYAPKNIRLQRVLERDGADEQSVLQRMNKQWPEWKKLRRADFYIINDGKEALGPQIETAITFFAAKAKG